MAEQPTISMSGIPKYFWSSTEVCFTGVYLHFTGVYLHFTGVYLYFTGVYLYFTGVYLHFTGVYLHFTGVYLHFTGVQLATQTCSPSSCMASLPDHQHKSIHRRLSAYSFREFTIAWEMCGKIDTTNA